MQYFNCYSVSKYKMQHVAKDIFWYAVFTFSYVFFFFFNEPFRFWIRFHYSFAIGYFDGYATYGTLISSVVDNF